jgi:tetratricopeptide (TPR) repeat protein
MRLRGVALWLGVLVLAGCGKKVEPPAPPTEGAEPLVLARLHEATEAVSADRKSATAWGRLGEIYDVHRLAEPALVCYAEAERLAPEDWRWPYFTGIVLRESDRVRSLAALERAAKLQPSYAPLQIYLGLAAFAAEDADKAKASFERALELDPTSINARIGLARVALAKGNAAGARDGLLEAAHAAPEEAAVHHHLAQAYRALGDQASAESEQKTAETAKIPLQGGNLASFPDPVREDVILAEGASTAWLLANAQRYLARGQKEQAAATIDRAIEASPQSTSVLLAGARIFADQGQADRAFNLVEQAVRLRPDDATGYVELGTLFVRANQTPKAIEAFEKALSLDPNLAQVRSNLATLYYQSGRTADGTKELRVASHAQPANLDIQYNLAASLVNSGDTAGARKVLTEALAVDPSHIPSRYLLGVVQAQEEHFTEAVQSFKEVIARDPSNNEARIDLGRAQWEMGRYADSIASFREAQKLAPRNPEIAREVAWSLAVCPDEKLRNGQEALAMARALAEQGGARDPRYLDLLAAAQAETGDFQGAVETGDRAIRIIQNTIVGRRDRATPAQMQLMQDFLRELTARVDGYRNGKPHRDRG